MSKKLDKLLIGVSLVVVFAIVACLYFQPEASESVANAIKSALIRIFGSGTMIFTFFGVLLLVGIAFSKFGNIRLGDTKPEYSTFKWIAMMMSCGLGSATCYWAFIEWAYYIDTPGLGIEAASQLAYEMSVPYTMFHWGFSAWTLYALAGIPIAYHFHVRKNKGLSLSGMVHAVTGLKEDGIICRIIDVLFIFICFGGLSITLGVSVPLVTDVLCSVIGIQSSFIMNLAIIIILSVIYSLSSYIGIQKGMSKISDWNVKLVIIFTIGVVICGPTLFILDNTTQSFGLMLQNFVHMSLFTDPIGQTGFPGAWTIFYWLYWITYAPFTGIFIAKVSKGRSIRSVIINTLVSGSVGGLTTIEEKSMGALHKTGSRPIVDILEINRYGVDRPEKPGFYLSEASMLCGAAGVNFAAMGAHIILWTSGAAGFNNAIVPVIRVSGNKDLFNADMDVDATGIMDGTCGIGEVAERIVEKVGKVADGEATAIEGIGDSTMTLYQKDQRVETLLGLSCANRKQNG